MLTSLICLSFTANWSIVNLRPAPPLRPTLINSNSTSSGSSGAILANTKKIQPTYEEDALVLRVIEAYCVAYQNPTRNALHSGLYTHILNNFFVFFYFRNFIRYFYNQSKLVNLDYDLNVENFIMNAGTSFS